MMHKKLIFSFIFILGFFASAMDNNSLARILTREAPSQSIVSSYHTVTPDRAWHLVHQYLKNYDQVRAEYSAQPSRPMNVSYSPPVAAQLCLNSSPSQIASFNPSAAIPVRPLVISPVIQSPNIAGSSQVNYLSDGATRFMNNAQSVQTQTTVQSRTLGPNENLLRIEDKRAKVQSISGGIGAIEIREQQIKFEISRALTILQKCDWASLKIVQESTEKILDPAKAYTQRAQSQMPTAENVRNLLELRTLRISVPELDAKLQRTIDAIEKIATGNRDFFTQRLFMDNNPFAKEIEAFKSEVKTWLEGGLLQSSKLEEQCLDDVIMHQNNIFDAMATYKSTPFDPVFRNTLVSSEQYKDLVQVQKLCQKGLFDAAQKICSKYENSGATFFFKPLYDEQLAHADKQFHVEILQALNIQNPMASLDGFTRGLSKAVIKGPDATNTYLVQTFADPKILPEIKQLQEKLLPQGLPAFCNYNKIVFESLSRVTSNQTKQTIDISKHPAEQKLIFDLARIPISNDRQALQIATCVTYIKLSISDDPAASSYKILGQELARALLNPDQKSSIVLELGDYSCQPVFVDQQEIQRSLVEYYAAKISKPAKNEADLQKEHGIMRLTDACYRSMLDGDIKAQKNFASYQDHKRLNREAITLDFEQEIAQAAMNGQQAIVSDLQESQAITQEMIAHGPHYQLIQYQLTPELKQFLISNGMRPINYESLYGNQLQQNMHKNFIAQLTRECKHSQLISIATKQLHELHELSIESTRLGFRHNDFGLVRQASALSHFCWQILDHIDNSLACGNYIFTETCAAVDRGITKGANNVIKIIEDPIVLLHGIRNASVAAVKLTGDCIKLNRSLDKVHDLRLAMPNDLAAIQKAEIELAAQLTPIDNAIDAVVAKIQNTTVLGAIEETTAFATETFLMGQIVPPALEAAGEIASPVINSVAAVGSKVSEVLRDIATAAKTASQVETTIGITTEGIAIEGISAETAAKATQNFVTRDMHGLGRNANKKTVAAANRATRAEQGVIKVSNKYEFFETTFGKCLKEHLQKTNYEYNKQTIFKITDKIPGTTLVEGDLVYLDSLHLDHIECFGSNGKIKTVLNLDGTQNINKSYRALKEKRRINM